MVKSYPTLGSTVNYSFWADPSVAALARCGTNSVLRLIQAGYDCEQYRDLLTKAVADGRAQRKKARAERTRTGKVSGCLFINLPVANLLKEKKEAPVITAGRPALDPVLMFRVVLLAVLTNRSDSEMALAIASDALVRHFVRVGPGSFISRQAIWDYREFFTQSGVFESIFLRHVNELRTSDLVGNDGPLILDGSFVEAPKQRNTPEENKLIKEGRGGELFNDNPSKKSHKDIDARWTKKRGEVHFGYKIHPLVDAVNKIILFAPTTSASVHDSQALGLVLNEEEDKGKMLYADSAYAGKELEELVRSFNVEPCFCEKGYKNRPLTQKQKDSNKQKSKTRCRIEHVFGFIQTVFKGSCVRMIGIVRATAHNWLMAFAYNLCRQEMLCRQQE